MGISCFLRTIVVQFIGLRDAEMIKMCFKTVLKYLVITGIIFSVVLALSAPLVSRIFFSKPEYISLLNKSIWVYCVHLTINFCLPTFNSICRYLLSIIYICKYIYQYASTCPPDINYRYLELKTFNFLIVAVEYNILITITCAIVIIVLKLELVGIMFSYMISELIMLITICAVLSKIYDRQIDDALLRYT